jgi:exonuclease SbcC
VLQPGDICPICGHEITALPGGEHADLQAAKAACDEARSDEERARQQAENLARRLVLAEQSLESLSSQLQDARGEHGHAEAQLTELLPGERPPTKEIASRVKEMSETQKLVNALRKEDEGLSADLERRSRELAEARGSAARIEAEAKAHTAAAERAAAQVAEAVKALLKAARDNDWHDVRKLLEEGRDVTGTLRTRINEAQVRESRMNQDIGANEARIEQLHRDIARANELREKEKEHHRMATLARDLASLLRADRLPAFIREQELRALARDGSERLKEISDGRYDFQVEGQDFVIVDHWNIGETRSVRTLSGGETFLASLALALALADRLPGLMSGVEGSSLESLFIDEGFSHLDDETLDTVASALEVLGQDRRRLIGVITHLSALADRMPARIVVNKRRTGSTVTVE